MIQLFNIPNHRIDTSEFSHLLHGSIVGKFEENFAEYVGAKYACTANSASSLLYLALKRFESQVIQVPSTIPVVVPNMVANAGHKIRFYNDEKWVGSCYHLHDDIFDSAQEVTKNQYADLGKDDAIMVFSFYPTKPVSGCDGGIVVSNNKDKIDYFKLMTMNGTFLDKDSWNRKHIKAGYKMHWTSFQAHVANENLKKLDEKNEVLEKINSVYNSAFGYNNKSRHLYRIEVKHNHSFLAKMLEEEIGCGIHYEHCHGKAFRPYEVTHADLTKSEKTSTTTASLPFHEELTFKEVEKVIHYAKKFKGV
tara:strand:- start:3198 stop:4118 length:921 start_codon:yes stop_codon:yes gene_type:complete